jgi:glyoxylase-like metal-dependent hydrolase (beta-lactamase superfamily II)
MRYPRRPSDRQSPRPEKFSCGPHANPPQWRRGGLGTRRNRAAGLPDSAMRFRIFNRRPAAAVREAAPGIFMITERGMGTIRPPINCYVITGEDGLVFDAGYGNRAAVKSFIRAFRSIEETCRARGAPCRVGRILISHAHPDHFPGLPAIREELGLSIVLTGRQAELIADRRSYRRAYDSRQWERELEGRDRLSGPAGRIVGALISAAYEWIYGMRFVPDPDVIIGDRCGVSVNGETWTIFPSPGHSDDHISLYDPGRGHLFAGDNVLEKTITWLGPPRSDLAAYTGSLEALQALPKLELILGAHGSPVTRPVRRIGSIILWRTKRLDDVMAAVRDAGREGVTARGILRVMYRRGGPMRRFLGEGWVLLAIRALMDRGAVTRGEAKGKVIFRAADDAVTAAGN